MQDQRGSLLILVGLLVSLAPVHAQVMRPVVSADLSPVQEVRVTTPDGVDVFGVLRAPPGSGPFPAVIVLHGGISSFPESRLRTAIVNPTGSRFLASGYVTVVPTFTDRARGKADVLAIVDYVKEMDEVDGDSVVFYGCSAGGDLALEVASETRVAATVIEEPATVIVTGMANANIDRFQSGDLAGSVQEFLNEVEDDPERFYSNELRQATRELLGRIEGPVFSARGSPDTGLSLIAELEAAGVDVEQALYSGEGHCFGLDGLTEGSQAFFDDMDAFFTRHVSTPPRRLTQVDMAPIWPQDTFVWVDREGLEAPTDIPPRAYAYGSISPDGTRILLNSRDESAEHWIWDIERETSQQVSEGFNQGTVWAPDGLRFAFSGRTGNTARIYWQADDGTPEPLTDSAPVLAFPTDITAGGDLIFTLALGPGDVWRVPLGGEAADAVPLISGPADEASGNVSPNGRWIAYDSNESGRLEVYVRPYPEVDAGLWQISTGGGSRPHWSNDGAELFFYGDAAASERQDVAAIMAVAIEDENDFRHGEPQMLFEGEYLARYRGLDVFDVTPDGQRFLLIKNADESLAGE